MAAGARTVKEEEGGNGTPFRRTKKKRKTNARSIDTTSETFPWQNLIENTERRNQSS